MDRKQAFKKAESLINRASTLYALRDYDLKDSIDFPLGATTARIFKGKRMNITSNMAVSGIKAKVDRLLNIKLKLEIQRYSDEDFQQIVNSVMRIFTDSIMKKIDQAILSNSDEIDQKRINFIGRTNNACIFLLEIMAREIIMYRVLEKEDFQKLEGLSSKVLLYLITVIRRHMIAQNIDDLYERCNAGNVTEYEKGLLASSQNYQTLYKSVSKILNGRGVEQSEEQIKNFDKDIKDYVSGGYARLFC